jgi:hypothetical protein
MIAAERDHVMKSTVMNRRHFIRLSAFASAALLHLPIAFSEEGPVASVRMTLRTDRLGNKIGNDFTGLSYESAQLGDPQFFSGNNTELVGFVQRLGNSGVLRIGGNTSEYCDWTPNPEAKPTAQDNGSVPKHKTTPIGFGFSISPDTGQKVPARVNIDSLAIRNLRDFLDATGWKLIYGLNMGTGTREDAAAEAAYVMDVVGTKLLAFQLCNEPDLFYRNGLRKPDYDFGQFAPEWERFFQTIRARVPNAPFAGPDTAYNNEWLVPFVKRYQMTYEGGMGINFHAGGYGWYTPISGTRENGFLARPIYYGMLLFAQGGAGPACGEQTRRARAGAVANGLWSPS